MPEIKERDVVRYLNKQTSSLNGEVRKVRWEGRRGAPDKLVMLDEISAFVEVKKPGEELEDHQLREHRRLRHSGLLVYVVDSFDTVDAMLLSMRRKKRLTYAPKKINT